MKSNLKYYIYFITLLIINTQILSAETYPTKLYKWTKLSSLDGSIDTSFYLYSKIQRASNGTLILGGRGYYTLYQRSILQSDDDGKSWQIAFPQSGNYIDYIIDSKDRLVITGLQNDSANYIYIKDLHTNIIDSMTVITEKNLEFSRPREYENGKYFIKANDQFNTYLFILDYKDTSLTQIIPRVLSNDSVEIKINKDLMTFQDYVYNSNSGEILISTFQNLYSTVDLFENIKHRFYDKYQFSIYKQIELNNGSFLYSHYIFDSTLQDESVVGLYGYDETNNTQKTYLTHYIKEYKAMNPISLMACSNDNYIVVRMGCSSWGKGFDDFINIDSLMISDDRGETFFYVPMPIPEGNFNYNYYAFTSPSVTKNGDIFLIINSKYEDKDWPHPYFVDVYYGVPDDVGVMNEGVIDLIYPNPATDIINIDLGNYTLQGMGEGQTIRIFDVLGEKVMTIETRSNVSLQQIDVSALPPGVYFVKVGEVVQKFVKI